MCEAEITLKREADHSKPAAAGNPAHEVVEEIRALGGEAIANGDDVADWGGAGRLIAAAVTTFGRLDVLVNNAGFVRDRMFVSATEDEWDAVLRSKAASASPPTPPQRPASPRSR